MFNRKYFYIYYNNKNNNKIKSDHIGKMKLAIVILPLFCGLALGQFGGFGGFGSSIANTFQKGIDTIASHIENVPFVNDAKNFADFAVSYSVEIFFKQK